MDQAPNQDQPQPAPAPEAQPTVDQSTATAVATGGFSAPATTPISAPVAVVNPGKTLGIVGIVLSFIALAPVGLVLSIVSLVKSSKVGASKTLGIVGVVLNALAILSALMLIPLLFATLAGVQERAKDSSAVSYANEVIDKVENYGYENNAFPSNAADLTGDTAGLSNMDYSVIDGQPTVYSEVGYELCSETKAAVYYYVTSEKSVKSVASDGSDTGC